jgi:hypothetical protein
MPIKIYNTNVNNNELNNLLKNNTLFVGIFSETCSHCINMKSEWNKFKSLLVKENLNGTILEINAKVLSSIKNPLISNNANGFPSLFIISNNKFVTNYNSERTGEKFLQFLKKYIPKMRSTKPEQHTLKKGGNKSKKTKLGKKISLCKYAKNGINGCNICCYQFKKRKTYKRCIRRCMK